MTVARHIMTPSPQTIGEKETLRTAALLLKEAGVGALPIQDEANHLIGMLSDRDIVVRCLSAEDGNPATDRAGDYASGRVVAVDANDDLEEVLRVMSTHQLRRVPVLDGDDLVGIISQADIARRVPFRVAGETLRRISE